LSWSYLQFFPIFLPTAWEEKIIFCLVFVTLRRMETKDRLTREKQTDV
jgi:hypothetical protein